MHPEIRSYNSTLEPKHRAICDLLAAEIDTHLPEAELNAFLALGWPDVNWHEPLLPENLKPAVVSFSNPGQPPA